MTLPVRIRPLSRAGLAALSLAALAGCGPAKNEFPPVCPNVSYVPPLSDLTRYRPGSQGGDITDLVVQAKLQRVGGKCETGDTKSQLNTSVNIVVDVQRGIAMQGRQLELPLFLAVTEGNSVLDKKVYSLQVTFPPNVDHIMVSSPPIDMTLPISPTKSGAAYNVIAGFQLTPEELAANRQKGAR